MNIAFLINIQLFSGCGFANVDLVIVIDSSTSYGVQNYYTTKRFFQTLIANSDLDSGSVRVGALLYSTSVQVGFHLNKYSTKNDVVQAIGNLPYMYGSTNTADALKLLRTEMFTADNGDRPENNNIAILFTDGRANINRNRTFLEAYLAKSEGIKMYVIGVNEFSETYSEFTKEVEQIASSPPEEHLFVIDNFGELDGLEKHIFITICPGTYY